MAEPPSAIPAQASAGGRGVIGLSLAWLVVVALCGISAPWLPLPDPNAMDLPLRRDLPSFAHPFGMDPLGRDILARAAHGARVSLLVAVVAPLIGIGVGGFLGLLAGYFGGVIDRVVTDLVSVVLAFPQLLLLVVAAYYLGASVSQVAVLLGVLSIPAFARVARASTLVFARREFVLAARAGGATRIALLFIEILPNILPSLIAYGLIVSARAIVAEGSLSFLGLSVTPPTSSWGGMIAEGREHLALAPHTSLIPALVMFLTVLSVNLLGEALRGRVLDSKEAHI